MIDKKFIVRKIDMITMDLEYLKALQGLTIDEIARDFLKYSALKNILMEIIGRAIDINNHMIASIPAPEIESPKSYKDTFLTLGKLKILPIDFAAEIAQSAGFRNAIVHDYNDIDKHIVYKRVDDIISQYASYCEYVLKSQQFSSPSS